MTGLAVKTLGWSEIPLAQLSKIYLDFNSRQNLGGQDLTFCRQAFQAELTKAERFGVYVRDLFAVYTSILEEMKTSRQWVALQVHSTYHSKANWPESIILGSDDDPNQVQVRGLRFDPVAFHFPWEDNSLDQPWKPWGWQIDILAEDRDETHIFIDLLSSKMFTSRLTDHPEITFFSMRPRLTPFWCQVPNPGHGAPKE